MVLNFSFSTLNCRDFHARQLLPVPLLLVVPLPALVGVDNDLVSLLLRNDFSGDLRPIHVGGPNGSLLAMHEEDPVEGDLRPGLPLKIADENFFAGRDKILFSPRFNDPPDFQKNSRNFSKCRYLGYDLNSCQALLLVLFHVTRIKGEP